MTVAELIKALKKCNLDAQVYVYASKGPKDGYFAPDNSFVASWCDGYKDEVLLDAPWRRNEAKFAGRPYEEEEQELV